MKPHPLGTALLAGDQEAVEAFFADNVELYSPVIHDPPFVGRAAVHELLTVVLPELGDVAITHEATDGDTHFMLVTASVRGQQLRGTWVLEHDQAGKVEKIWVMIRPLRANARIVAIVGAGLAKARGNAAFTSLTKVSSSTLVRYVDTVTAVGSRIIRQLNERTSRPAA